jgi:preprotein translocase subunit SecA
MYEKLAGMTGTAVTEAEEFRKIYDLDVVVIPTHRNVARLDHSDAVYKTQRAKLGAVVAEVEAAHKKGQPVLIGTTSIDKNPVIAEYLKRKKIPHALLNAKNHLQEAEIIANAGKKGAVTVATNMAGRGVDIVLGGESPKDEEGITDTKSAEYKKWEKEHQEVLDAGGLYVIGTERHESRRIDNQLRGRSGRQGDAGASRFFVALDDDIMRLFGGDRIAGIMTRFNMAEDVPLEHPLVSRSIENAQVKVEGFNFDTRKHLVKYDDVLNKQREIIYKFRREILEASKDNDTSTKEEIQTRLHAAVNTMVDLAFAKAEGTAPNETIVEEFSTIVPFDEASQKQLVTQLEQIHESEGKKDFLIKMMDDLYDSREKQIGAPLMRQLERFVMLSVVDNLWMNHLDIIDNLRQGIGLRGYAQRDPLVEYKNEAYRMFEQLMFSIDDDIVHRIYKLQIQQAPPANNPPHGQPGHVHDTQQHTHADGSVHSGAPHPEEAVPALPKTQKKKLITNTPESEVSEGAQAPIQTTNKLNRNDPCWCGSGKKWKKCHYPNLAA